MRKIMIFCLFCLLSHFGYAQQTQIFEINTQKDSYFMGEFVYVLPDSAQELSVEQVSSDSVNQQFLWCKKLFPNASNYIFRLPKDRLGNGFYELIPQKYIYWSRLTIKNNLSKRYEGMFYIGFGNLLDVYISQKTGGFELKKTGQYMPAAQKDVLESRNYVVRLELEAGEQKTIYIKSTKYDGRSFSLQPILFDKIMWTKNIFKRNWIEGIFHGLLWMMVAYNLLIFFTNRDQTYIYYAFYILNVSLYFLFFKGFNDEFFTTENPEINPYIWTLTLNFLKISYFQFMRHYLQTKILVPKLDRFVLLAIKFLLIFTALEIAFIYFTFNIVWLTIITSIISVLMVLLGIWGLFTLYRTKNQTARFFVAGSATLILSGVFGSLYSFYNIFDALFFGQAGIILEILIFSIGLGYRMKTNQQEKEQAQADLITQLERNQQIQIAANNELEQKVKERTETLEKQSLHIKDSIVYASRIQNALIGNPDAIISQFDDAFIFFRPRDIVSGDFYFFREEQIYDDISKTTRKFRFLIVADCTGHGVPGAFMTIMGSNFLDEIIDNQKIVNPSQILSELDRKVIAATQKQNTGKKSIQDGMDLSLLLIDEAHKKIHFAAAKNPIFYVRNHEIFQLKGSKFPIGSSQFKEQKTYETQIIDYQTGDQFYLFSDGFQDQFGADGRKFMIKKFRELILNISHLSMEKQQNTLDQTLRDWQTNSKQTDDILVVGIKL
ncbi:MAG: hypothetical protein EAZ97_06445 [Bacteroidetes bacterium]|nr:MAG: hypothetical protein EAZ97_06445 [Bacteroidota bacterium]